MGQECAIASKDVVMQCSLQTASRVVVVRKVAACLHSVPGLSLCRAMAASVVSDHKPFKFGPHTIRGSEVFLTTHLSFAFVNLKPVVPGHVLVSPQRVALRFADLTLEEVTDLWTTAQTVGKTLERHYKADSLTLAIQDGPAAGQTVPHVHIHVLPRHYGDFPNNDDVYDAIDHSEDHLASHLPRVSEKLDLDAKPRQVRTLEEMAEEAAVLRALFQ